MPYVDTNTAFRDTQNPNIPKADRNMSDFINSAKKFAANAKAEGVDPIGIAEGIKFMYGLTQQNIANEQAMTSTPSQQGSLDLQQQGLELQKKEQERLDKGTWDIDSANGIMVNRLTGETRPIGGTSGGNPSSYFDGEPGKTAGASASTPAPSQKQSGLGDFINNFSTASRGGFSATNSSLAPAKPAPPTTAPQMSVAPTPAPASMKTPQMVPPRPGFSPSNSSVMPAQNYAMTPQLGPTPPVRRI